MLSDISAIDLNKISELNKKFKGVKLRRRLTEDV